ncbi:MAG: hypothetical protein HY655_00210 [Acidobacteria bacterium]|nr:hypothetical protein [Acidobacteriota bacterium]
MVGLATGPVFVRMFVNDRLLPSSLTEYSVEAPDAMTEGFFATTGLVVSVEPDTSYVPEFAAKYGCREQDRDDADEQAFRHINLLELELESANVRLQPRRFTVHIGASAAGRCSPA